MAANACTGAIIDQQPADSIWTVARVRGTAECPCPSIFCCRSCRDWRQIVMRRAQCYSRQAQLSVGRILARGGTGQAIRDNAAEDEPSKHLRDQLGNDSWHRFEFRVPDGPGTRRCALLHERKHAQRPACVSIDAAGCHISDLFVLNPTRLIMKLETHMLIVVSRAEPSGRMMMCALSRGPDLDVGSASCARLRLAIELRGRPDE